LDELEGAAWLRPASERRIGAGVALTAVVFAAIALLLQWLRPDLDWIRHTLSAYVTGPYGRWLKLACFLMSPALGVLGMGYHGAVAGTARSRVPALLFAAAGVALAVTALADMPHPGGSHLEGVVHNVAAFMTFLCLTTAMVIQSWHLRRDNAWRRRHTALLSVALACFAGMWTYVFWHAVPRGLGEKLLIAGILVWLVLAAWWLRVHAMRRA